MTARDPADELGDALFAAARRERPSHAVRERVIAALASPVERAPIVLFAPIAVPSRRPRYRAIGALALAAVAMVTIVMSWRGREEPSIAISAERAGKAHEAPSARLLRAEEPAPVTAPPAELRRAPVATRARDAGRASRDDRRATKPIVAAPPASLTDEITMLDRARTALSGGDPAAALHALDDYDQVLHGTRLTAEATLLRIDALARSGRASAASDLASRFVEEDPGSALADRARAFIHAASAAETTKTTGAGSGGLP